MCRKSANLRLACRSYAGPAHFYCTLKRLPFRARRWRRRRRRLAVGCAAGWSWYSGPAGQSHQFPSANPSPVGSPFPRKGPYAASILLSGGAESLGLLQRQSRGTSTLNSQFSTLFSYWRPGANDSTHKHKKKEAVKGILSRSPLENHLTSVPTAARWQCPG